MRTLLLCREGWPMSTEISVGPLRAYLRRMEGIDDIGLFSIIEVHPLAVEVKSDDITVRIAEEWSREIAFGDGIEPTDYLAPFPAFVRMHASPMLIAKWQADVAGGDRSFLPNPLRRAAA